VPNPITAALHRPRRPARPWSGLVILLGMAAILVILVLAAYHGSSQTPPSDCARATSLLRRTDTDAVAARQAVSTTGSVPAADLAALRTDGDRLTAMVQNEPESDLAFDEKLLPVTDAITTLVGTTGARSTALVNQVATLYSNSTAVDSFCGVGS
jgi:hypothetical protein